MNPAFVMQLNFRCVAHLYGWEDIARGFFVQATRLRSQLFESAKFGSCDTNQGSGNETNINKRISSFCLSNKFKWDTKI